MAHIDTHEEATFAGKGELPSGDIDRFVSELTRLSQECGIGIADSPTLYVMERDEHDFTYHADADSKLVLR